MIKLDKHRIHYEGMIDFAFEERRDSFYKALKRVLRKDCVADVYKLGKFCVVFHGIAYVNRKSHKVDDDIKALVSKFKVMEDITALRIDKSYMSNPVMLYAYISK
jgi:hypothetical protein